MQYDMPQSSAIPAPVNPSAQAQPTSAVNPKSGSFWGGVKGLFKAKTQAIPPQSTGTLKQGVWATAKPGSLAPAHPVPLGDGGVIGDGNTTSQYSSYASNDWQRNAMFSPPPPTAAQFPRAAYNDFDQLENWYDPRTAIESAMGQSVASVVMKN